MLAAQTTPDIHAIAPARLRNHLQGFVSSPFETLAQANATRDYVQEAGLKRSARGVLSTIAPLSVIAERTFKSGESRFVLLATALPHGRRIPRSPELVRLAIAGGIGLRLRAIGRLAVVVLKLPLASETVP